MTTIRKATAFCSALLWTIGTIHAETALSINAPIKRQVCQRNDRNQTDVVVADMVRPAVDIIESLNKDAGYDLTWVVAQASLHTKSEEPEEKEVARGQQLLWKEGIAKRGPNTDELGPEHRSDGVHFNQNGLTAHAERWFKALADEYKWKAE